MGFSSRPSARRIEQRVGRKPSQRGFVRLPWAAIPADRSVCQRPCAESFGLKTTVGHWSTKGVFPLFSTLDSVGILSRSAQDAALIYATVSRRDVVSPAAVDSLRRMPIPWKTRA
jgi:hypothetical protein